MNIENLNNISNSGITSNNTDQTAIYEALSNNKAGEYVSSNASLAARAYATPQINFQGRYDKILLELLSDKPSKNIQLSLKETTSLLERFGFKLDRINGSHHQFTKKGTPRITVATHNGKEVKPGTIDDLRAYINKNNITEL